jgi:competence protein ComGC
MNLWFELVATVCTGIFAGAALYINLVEHPARMECGTAVAATEFGPSYRRAAVMQVSLAALAFLAAMGAWAISSRWEWLLGGILIVVVIPYTLIAIRPTNNRLLDPALDRNSDLARQLLRRWAKLHAVRTVLSLAAFLLFCWAIVTPAQVDRSTRLKEAALRRTLFTLRSQISQYTLDKQKAPQSLNDLVEAGYIKSIPIDPMTGRNDTWTVEQDATSGIINVHSGSEAASSDGSRYNTW